MGTLAGIVTRLIFENQIYFFSLSHFIYASRFSVRAYFPVGTHILPAGTFCPPIIKQKNADDKNP